MNMNINMTFASFSRLIANDKQIDGAEEDNDVVCATGQDAILQLDVFISKIQYVLEVKGLANIKLTVSGCN